MQQGGFTAAIGAQYAPDFPFAKFKIQIPANGFSVYAQRELAGLEAGAVHEVLSAHLCSSQTKTGTQIIVSRMPSGSCCGASNVRAQVSASVTRLPPSSAATGRMIR